MYPTAGSPDEKLLMKRSFHFQLQSEDARKRPWCCICRDLYSDEPVIMLFIMISRLQAVLQSKQCPRQDLEVGSIKVHNHSSLYNGCWRTLPRMLAIIFHAMRARLSKTKHVLLESHSVCLNLIRDVWTLFF